MTLLKAGADTDKRSADGSLAIELAPDVKVRPDEPRGICCRLLTGYRL